MINEKYNYRFEGISLIYTTFTENNSLLNELRKQCQELVYVDNTKYGKYFLTNSKIMSKNINIPEEDIVEKVKHHSTRLEKMGEHTLITKVIMKKGYWGTVLEFTEEEICMLNEKQFILILHLLCNDRCKDFKDKVIQEFKNKQKSEYERLRRLETKYFFRMG